MESWVSRTLARIRRLVAERKVSLAHKALSEMDDLDLGLDELDVCEVLSKLTPGDCVHRLRSKLTGERMYVFKPCIAGTVVYLKVVLRENCIVVSFHEDTEEDEE